MIKLKNKGYVFISRNGIEYELLEGITIGAARQRTSDIIFIMLSNTFKYDIQDGYVGHIYGATFLEENIDEYNNYISNIVEKFEKIHNLKEKQEDE